jgi:hypothetical protein
MIVLGCSYVLGKNTISDKLLGDFGAFDPKVLGLVFEYFFNSLAIEFFNLLLFDML